MVRSMDFFGPVIFNCEEAFSIHTKPFLPVNLFTGTFFFLCSLILTVCAHLQGVTCFISLEDKRRKKTIMNYVSILNSIKKFFISMPPLNVNIVSMAFTRPSRNMQNLEIEIYTNSWSYHNTGCNFRVTIFSIFL